MILYKMQNGEEINYYINQCLQLHLSRNELRDRIKNKEYERLPENTKLKPNYEVISEKTLKKLILENIDNFLLELGSGFSYIENKSR